ncbi:DNA (cytosine-5-)-methyltransferase [Halomarina oriensis]|uniref:DNA (cytosine-5-)-methyltransferase n=1 Tax=Halomarina oriensis TaxID=671145 RepID=A0A6B0GM05_9EURY|nr:DNA (cytosine-5-)-methyltransferase [Halomarina oriensis]MWG34727.1 DNA (cytosine-5-)-methyltransferase [Halomarina oriensis]
MAPKVLDLFCGAGGFSLGFHRAGFEVVGAIDYEPAALETFRLHHDTLAVPADLSRLLDDGGPTGEDLLDLVGLTPADVDVVIGGPPCQGYSQSSDRDPDDPINDLVWTFLEVVEAADAHAFAMENVPGLLEHKGGETMAALVECADSLGYNVAYEVLNAADFEVPQNRHRVIFFGVRGGEPTHPEPLGGEPIPVQEALSQVTGELLPDNEWTDHRPTTVEKIAQLNVGESLHGKHRQVRLDPTKPARTITASNRHIHPFEDRELSIRECAVLQSFPPTYDFAGWENRDARTRQVGNAVPPKLAEHIAYALLKSLWEVTDRVPTDSVRTSSKQIAGPTGRLTEREVEATLLRAGGLTWEQVGDEMGITYKTASTHYYRAREKAEMARETFAVFERLNLGERD